MLCHAVSQINAKTSVPEGFCAVFLPPLAWPNTSQVLTTTVSPVVLSVVRTAGVELITAVASGACIVLGSWANSGCFLRMCCTIFVCREMQKSNRKVISISALGQLKSSCPADCRKAPSRLTLRDALVSKTTDYLILPQEGIIKLLWLKLPDTEILPQTSQSVASYANSAKYSGDLFQRLSSEATRQPHTLLLYCLEQWGQQTGGVAMVPVSWVWVLSIGSGSPGPAGRSFRMLGGSSAPGWFFRMCALRLLALLYTCGAKIWNGNDVTLMSAQKPATSSLYLGGLRVAVVCLVKAPNN